MERLRTNEEYLPTSNPNQWIAKEGTEAANKMDLLSVLLHEYGHALGIAHSADSHDYMAATLAPGVRRLPSSEELSLMAQLAGQARLALEGVPADTPNPALPLSALGFALIGRLRRTDYGAWTLDAQSAQLLPQKQIAINATLQNGDLTDDTAWQTNGNVQFDGAGQATLGESDTAQSHLSQSFLINPGDRTLRFTLSGVALDDINNGPDDAFEVALLNANTGESLKANSGLSHSDALLNLQADGTERLASGISRILNLDGSRTYLVDLTGIPTGTAAYLSFNLIGFGAATSHATLSDIRLGGLPQTQDDIVVTDEDTPLRIDALANDIDTAQPGFVPIVVTGPAHGQVTVNPDGSFSYTPDKDYHGSDNFTYRLGQNGVFSNEATITLEIRPVNDAPVLTDSSAVLDEDSTLKLQALTTAQDIDGDPLTARIISAPTHGTLTVNPDGSFTYAPEADYYGTDSYTYVVNDGTADSNVATVSFTVTPVNDAPVAQDGSATLAEDGSVILDLIALGHDIDTPIVSAIVTEPSHGSLTQNADGTFTYTSDLNWNGADRFTYQFNDGELTSNQATITLTVNAVNDAPTLADQALMLDEDGSLTLRPLTAAQDIDGDPLSARIIAGPQHGSLTANTDGAWTYAPDANYYGTDSYTYVVNDGTADSNIATVNLTITPVNDAPELLDQTLSANEDRALTGKLLASATDIDGDTLSATVITKPAHGQLTINPDGSFTYTPEANWSGEDRFTYQVSDGKLSSHIATVKLTVVPVADVPALQLGNAHTTQRLFTTGWETAANTDKQSTLIRSNTLDGWTLITRTGQYDKGEGNVCDQHGQGQGLGGGRDGFEIWSAGDQMVDNRNQAHTVTAAQGNGSNWLELNDAGGNQHQTLGISRAIQTEAGTLYTLGFDLAGRLGYDSDTTRIAVYVDNIKVGSFDHTSPANSLNWQHAQIQFTGKGGSQTIRIVTEASKRESAGRGMMLDGITLDQTSALNQGKAGSAIPLQSISARLTDTDGSETLHLALAGLPAGSTISDGNHSLTLSADQLIADITGWNTQALAVTPPLSSHGTFELRVMAVAQEQANGDTATASQALNLQVDAVAQTPTLTLTARSDKLSRQLINTRWEGQCDPNTKATVLERDQLEGWHTTPIQKGKKRAFILWGNNDLMTAANGQRLKAQAVSPERAASLPLSAGMPLAGTPDSGKQWLALTNGIDSGADKRYQNLGIEREIDTLAGANYTLNLNYAGALAANNTKIIVTLDGQAIGSYAASSSARLEWKALNFSFTGDGKQHELAIQLEANSNSAAGAMLDTLTLVETLPNSPNTVYGLRGTAIALPQIQAQKAVNDPGALKTELLGLPKGSIVSDGTGQVTIRVDKATLDLTGWNLAKLSLILPNGANPSTDLQVRTTCTETNGTTASATQSIHIKLLDGKACATPLGVNPYVRYEHDTRATTEICKPEIRVSPLRPENRSHPIHVPSRSSPAQEEETTDSDEAMKNWMKGLEHSLNKAFMAEMGRVKRGEERDGEK